MTDGISRRFHNSWVSAITGKCRNAGIPAAGNKNLIIGNIIQAVAIVQIDRTNRTGQQRRLMRKCLWNNIRYIACPASKAEKDMHQQQLTYIHIISSV
jgi:hypothetical protein